ncbi:MAG TPA: ferrous iron transport protein B [Terriglobales bacterium]|nr:ferrous iron transport protein B [Terriglobales bacterium]
MSPMEFTLEAPLPAQANPVSILSSRIQSIAVVGPPNSGKTTLFNRLTGLRQRVANFPGVTVEHHVGYLRNRQGEEIAVIDLPGIYSLSPKSEDERVTVDVLRGRMAGTPRPDAIVLILDSTNLNRHLVLAARVIALGLPTLVLLNLADALAAQGGTVDVLALARQLGTPVALIAAARGEGIEVVQNFVSSVSSRPAPPTLPVLNDLPRCREWAARVAKGSCYRPPVPSAWGRRLDAVFLDRYVGPLVFLAVVIGVFQCIFSLGQPLSDGLRTLLDALGQRLGTQLANGWLRSLVVDGAWKGVTSVLIFLPQIVLLFLVIGVLEDSGYLARAAVIADRTMKKVGLNGKAFIPLLSAYACAVPAVMATRTIEDKRDRIATILIAPFMTCSARLPVYTMVIAAFIPDHRLLGPFLGVRAAAMLGLYVLGFAAAVVTARILKSSILKSRDSQFILEMPAYRWPTLHSLGLRLLDRSKAFLVRAGTVILAVSLVLWGLTHLPLHHGQPPEIQNSVVAQFGHALEPAIRPLGFNWKIGVGLVTSIAAREVIISTLGTLNGLDPAQQSVSLQQALHNELSLAGAMALLVFFAFAMQCTSTLAVVRRETNSWRWPAIQFLYMTALAYGAALAVYQIGSRLMG